jgi:hypothetical protein
MQFFFRKASCCVAGGGEVCWALAAKAKVATQNPIQTGDLFIMATPSVLRTPPLV